MLSSKLVILTTVLGICLSDACPVGLPMRTPDSYVYIPVPFPARFRLSDISYISFAVQTCNDAHLALSTGTSTSQLDRGVSMYEIVIGGWANTQSVIRKTKQGPSLAVSRRHQLVNCSHFRRFYVSWIGGVVKVGEQREWKGRPGSYSDQPPFLSCTDPSPFPVHQVFVSGWRGQSGTWRIDIPAC